MTTPPGGPQTDPRELLTANMDLIRRITRAVARRYRLSDAATEDLESAVWLRLVERDYRALRQYMGRSSIATFLTVIVARLAMDVQSAEWGRWRPSTRARQLGEAAVRFETLVFRDGYSRDEAALQLEATTNAPPSRAMRALAASRRSRPRRYVPIELVAHTLKAADDPVQPLVVREQRTRAGKVVDILERAVGGLSEDEQRLLRMRHAQGLKVSTMSRRLGIEQKTLYRRLAMIHRRLRRFVSRLGVTEADALQIGRAEVEWRPVEALNAGAAPDRSVA